MPCTETIISGKARNITEAKPSATPSSWEVCPPFEIPCEEKDTKRRNFVETQTALRTKAGTTEAALLSPTIQHRPHQQQRSHGDGSSATTAAGSAALDDIASTKRFPQATPTTRIGAHRSGNEKAWDSTAAATCTEAGARVKTTSSAFAALRRPVKAAI
jgi:hypothetical protein